MKTEEIINLAGVDAMTLPAEVLENLSSLTDSQEHLEEQSKFQSAGQILSAAPVQISYINDKVKFNRAFATNGRGKAKTEDVSKLFRRIFVLTNHQQAIAVFCGFQTRTEALMATVDPN